MTQKRKCPACGKKDTMEKIAPPGPMKLLPDGDKTKSTIECWICSDCGFGCLGREGKFW